jgi:uncharacterized protein YjbI with pentapeptide repeats
MDASELLKRYAVGERDFLRVELSGANLSGDNLSEAKLSGANLSGDNLSGANLSGADLISADLSGAYLYATDLSGAYLISADLISADLCQADLRRANLSGARLIDADLIGADLSQAELIGADLSEAHLIGAKLIGADLRRADLSEANLRGADLIGADLRRADLSRAKLIDADLRRANLSGADLSGADLSGADLSGADLNNTNLIRAKFNENILTSQKISEELQQENRELRKRIEFFETQIENLIEDQVQKRLITNQGITAKKQTWNRLRFRSNAELEIAKVLDEIGVMYFPNASGRVMSESGMKTREVDFLICSRGKWGILECDGELWHFFKKGELPSAANDHKRDNDFNRHGQWFIKRFTAEECKKAPHQVVRQFLDMLHKFHEDQRYLVTGDFPQTEPSPLQSNLSLAEYDEDEDIVF